MSSPPSPRTDPPGSGRPRTRPRREDVRQAILDAAAEVFAERGIDGASLDDVAAAAGFTKGAVYSNFASKDELILALMDERVGAHLEIGIQAVRGSRRSPARRLRALGDRLTAALLAQRQWHLLFLELWQRALRDPQLGGSFTARRRALRQALTATITEQANTLGLTPRLTPEELAVVILALSNGLAIEAYPDPSAVPDELFGKVLELLASWATSQDIPTNPTASTNDPADTNGKTSI